MSEAFTGAPVPMKISLKLPEANVIAVSCDPSGAVRGEFAPATLTGCIAG